MSSFQKNTLLIVLLLAAIAYPPLFFSIQDAVKKETSVLDVTTPDTVTHIALGKFEIEGNLKDTSFPNFLELQLNYELSQLGGAVYFGQFDTLSTAKKSKLAYKFHGKISFLPNEISFLPKLELLETKQTVKGSPIFVRYEEKGLLSAKIYTSFASLLDETIRLYRIAKKKPSWNFPTVESELSELEVNMLSEKIAERGISGFSSDFFNSYNPRNNFIQYLKLKSLLTNQSEDKLKDVWKNVNNDQNINVYLKWMVTKEIGDFYFKKSEYAKALDFYVASRRFRESTNSVYHPEYAETISNIGITNVLFGKIEESLFYLNSAKQMFDVLGLQTDHLAIQNSIFHSLVLFSVSQKELGYYELYSLDKNITNLNERIYYLYNLSQMEYELSSYDAALRHLAELRKLVIQLGLPNEDISLFALNLEAGVYNSIGKWAIAKSKWESIVHAKSVYSIEEKLYYRYALYNLASLMAEKKQIEDSENLYKQYSRITPYNAIQNLALGKYLYGTIIYPYTWSVLHNSDFTELEEKTIRSYTGRYVFSGQEEEIRARTYEDRLEDTNLFLDDLLNQKTFVSKQITKLREILFYKIENYNRGNQVVFFDIGPALNHPDYPGVTSLAVANHFPDMEVVLWELPSEVELFLKKVSVDKKEKLYSFKNIRIFSADGVGDFGKDYNDPHSWILTNRPIPKLNNKTIIIRSANSIDIYEPYTKVLPHFQLVSKVLKDNPVIYFFNRSILLKKAGDVKFTLIGNQSVRGFHHNYQSLDRNGEPPYSILPYTINED
ncbi:tetratricopeptide repeat protein [Leptospira sp. 96542]|nr:tetratricopeptide repeat protein [Leptospira sp. 96542]